MGLDKIGDGEWNAIFKGWSEKCLLVECLKRIRKCYKLNYALPKFIGGSPNHNVTAFGDKALKGVIKVT